MRALVLGVNGQDGSFLAENLIRRGYQVIGIGRQNSSLYVRPENSFRYICADLCDTYALESVLKESAPDVIFHVAAVHGSAGTPYEEVFQQMLAVNMGSVQIILEYQRTNAPNSIFLYASSGKVFGPVYPQYITESSPRRTSCLYTITKMGAQGVIDCYRERYGVQASSLFLFNHESDRRPREYFIPIVLEILRKSMVDPTFQNGVNTLQFYCDWGSAEEYMDIAIDIAEKSPGEDFVFGSGNTWWAEKFVEALFYRHGLDYRNHIIEKNKSSAASRDSSPTYHVDTMKLRTLLGRAPHIDIMGVCERILENEVRPENG